MTTRPMTRWRGRIALATIASYLVASMAQPAAAFCGFYVAQADAKLFNKASKVVLAWDDGTASVTMASDYEGDPKEFAVVIPVPTFIERKQIGIVDANVIDHLDRYTAPRLVEYNDADPCAEVAYGGLMSRGMTAMPAPASAQLFAGHPKVVVEASYEVGEYDIQILSAQESDGLVDYLAGNGYRIPDGAGAVLGSYIKQKMHFFIAKVNLDRMELRGGKFIRPLQVRYQSKKFMLPIRLGTVNANGPQDLVIYALTRHGRVETTNYRTVKMPSGEEVPLYVKDSFGEFYKATFDRQVEHEEMSAVFVEYAWNMGWCDPCAADPLSIDEMQTLGARWFDRDEQRRFGMEAYVTRLHVRYDATHFPEDLALQETGDTGSFQARYVLQHPWQGAAACRAGDHYWRSLPDRYQQEATTLAGLTGWDTAAIRERMEASGQSFTAKPPRSWLERWFD